MSSSLLGPPFLKNRSCSLPAFVFVKRRLLNLAAACRSPQFATTLIIQEQTVFCLFRARQLAAGRSLESASCRGGLYERSCSKSATAIHSLAVGRTLNYRRPKVYVDVQCSQFFNFKLILILAVCKTRTRLAGINASAWYWHHPFHPDTFN